MHTLRILIGYAKVININGLNKWRLGNTIIGSWYGPSPKGSVNIRSGSLNLFTGEYTIARPLTKIFN